MGLDFSLLEIIPDSENLHCRAIFWLQITFIRHDFAICSFVLLCPPSAAVEACRQVPAGTVVWPSSGAVGSGCAVVSPERFAGAEAGFAGVMVCGHFSAFDLGLAPSELAEPGFVLAGQLCVHLALVVTNQAQR